MQSQYNISPSAESNALHGWLYAFAYGLAARLRPRTIDVLLDDLATVDNQLVRSFASGLYDRRKGKAARNV